MRPLPSIARSNRSRQVTPIRVMLVDDSRVTRLTFACVLEGNPDIEVVAQAQDSDQALELLKTVRADIILLDIEMPRRSGIDALPEIAKAAGFAKIIIVSAFAEKNGPAALKALSLGACDTLAKPAAGNAGRGFSELLLDKVLRLGRDTSHANAHPNVCSDAAQLSLVPPECIAIGASTGGIPIIFKLIKNLDDRVQCPLFIVQHLPEAFMDFFAGQLRSYTSRPVSIAVAGEEVKRGHIYVAPGSAHLICRKVRQKIFLDHMNNPQISRYCPSVDVLFSSLAKVYGSKALAIVLSGMGNDGVTGARLLSEQGAPIIVQDEASSVVWGMPGAVVREQLATAILSGDAMNAALSAAVRT
jgi:two-component system, chemotaxis family, protein-glutamate methylesterase/glutaminase